VGDRAVGYFTVLAIGLLAGMSLPAGPTSTVKVRERWAPLTQWECSPQEHREYVHACAHRERMDGILRTVKPATKGRT
jgi:hypothetical protein